MDLAGEAGVEGLHEDDGRSLGWTCAAVEGDSDTVAADFGYNAAGEMMDMRLS